MRTATATQESPRGEEGTSKDFQGCMWAFLGIMVAPWILVAVLVLGLAWLVTLCAEGFNHPLPYWPTLGSLVVLRFVAPWFRSKA